LVLDEFDKSLEFGYEEEIAFIMNALSNVRHKMYCSATEAVEIPAFATLDEGITLDFVEDDTDDWDKVIYQYTRSVEDEKSEDLVKLLYDIGNRSTVIFCNHKETVERLHAFIKSK